MFPLTITLKRQLLADEVKSAEGCINIIQEELRSLKVDKISVSNSHISFRNGFFNGQGNWHLMVPVDKGYFDLDCNLHFLKYQVSTKRMFLVVLVMSAVGGALATSFSVGMFFFFWLYGMNVLIGVVRHGNFLDNIVDKIRFGRS